MKRLVAAACAALSACVAQAQAAAPPAPVAARSAARAEADAARQLLVMLRLPPPHFRPDASYAGSYPGDSGRAARTRVARQIAEANGLSLVDEWPMPVIGIDCYVMQLPDAQAAADAIAALARDPRVAWAQPMNLFELRDAGGDPLLPMQPAARDWRLAELHRASTGRGVRVAVIDSGVDGAHPDLEGQLDARENFVDGVADAAERHGTAVAAIIAAREGNGVGIAGVAPQARLLALRACWEGGAVARCSSFTLGKALNFAILHEARIINLSLSGPFDRLLQTLLDAAARRRMAVVGAVARDGAAASFPADWPGVIAAAASGSATCSGDVLCAPGDGIPTAQPGARWGFVSGASYAAAHVSGLLALVAELRPGDDAAALRAQVAGSNQRGRSWRVGGRAQAGNIDACATIARVTGACACSCVPAAMKQQRLK